METDYLFDIPGCYSWSCSPKGCRTEVNNDCVFSAETDGVQLKNVNGRGVDNQAFEIEVCNHIYFLNKMAQHDN